MTTEELIDGGLPVYMNEFANWENTDMVHTLSHQIVVSKGTYTAVPKTHSNNTNFSEWLKSQLTNFPNNSLGPINNDGSRVLTRGNVELCFYFNEDGSVKYVDQKSPAYTLQVMKAYSKYNPPVPPQIIAQATTVRYVFTQKGAFQLTSLLPDFDFDGVFVTNDTIVDGVHWTQHPNFPTVYAWRHRFINANDRSGGFDTLVIIKNGDLITGKLQKAGGIEQNVDLLPEAEFGFMVAHTDVQSELGYHPETNIYWIDPSLNIAECQPELSLDAGLFKAEGSMGKAISVK